MTIYIKFTDRCNLKCKHCYNAANSTNSVDMSDETISKAIDYINGLTDTNEQNLIVFHGGEVFCAKDVISKMSRIIDSTKKKNVRFGLTTNLVHDITDEEIAFYKKYITNQDGWNTVGTSWDYDIRFGSEETEAKWKCNVRKLIDSGITVSAIVCVTKQLISRYPSVESIRAELLKYFSDIGITRANFDLVRENGNAKIYPIKPTNLEADEWLVKLYDALNGTEFKVRLFNEIAHAYHNISAGFPSFRRYNCRNNTRTINTNGTIACCPNVSNDYIFSLHDSSVKETKEFSDFKRNENHIPQKCLLCDLYEYCGGYCSLLAFDETGCQGMPKLIRRIIEDCKKQKPRV